MVVAGSFLLLAGIALVLRAVIVAVARPVVFRGEVFLTITFGFALVLVGRLLIL